MVDLSSAAAVMTTNDARGNTVIPFKPSSTGANDTQDITVKKNSRSSEDDQKRLEDIQKNTDNKQKNAKDDQVTQKLLDGLSNDIQALHSIGLTFSKNKDTGQTIITVINKDTNEVIREIPPKQVFSMAEKLDEMVGMFFETKA